MIVLQRVEIIGLITFRETPDDLSGATVHVRLLDTTLVDAPSETICEEIIRDDEFSGGARADLAHGIPFRLHTPSLEPRRRYEVSVHVDRGGTGEIERGDFLTTVSHPIATDRDAIETRITVDLI